MKKLFLILAAFLLYTALNAQQKINDANAEVREAKDFHAISISNSFDVFISQGNEEAVAVSASEEKYKENIKVEVRNGVLKIWLENKGKFWKGLNGDKMKLKAYISFKNIDKLTASGACDIHLQGTITADDLAIDLSGASDWKEGNINAKKLSVDLSGACKVNISGTAEQLNLEASGASDFRGYDFAVNYCDVRASGACSIDITINKELSARISGASDVRYKGTGMIKDIHTSGASNVSHKS
jgi:Putative auto-transporter adhesin, head GIN domain